MAPASQIKPLWLVFFFFLLLSSATGAGLKGSTIKKEHRWTTSLRTLHKNSRSPIHSPTDAPSNTGSTVTSSSPIHSPTDAPSNTGSTVTSSSPIHSPTNAPSKGEEEETEETITIDLFPFFLSFDEKIQDGDNLLEVLRGYIFDEMSKSFTSLSEILLSFTPLSEGRKLQEASLSFTGTASFVSTDGNYVPTLEELHYLQRTFLEAFDALREDIHLWDPEVTAGSAGIEMGKEAVEEEGNEAAESVSEDVSDQTSSEEQGDQESDREINAAEGNNDDDDDSQRTTIIAALTIVAVVAAVCFVFFVFHRKMQKTVKKPVAKIEQWSDHLTESKGSGSDHEIDDMEVAAVSEESSETVLANSDDVAEPEEILEGWASIFRHSSTAHREMLHIVNEFIFHDPQKDPGPVASIVPKLEEKQVVVLNRVAVEDGSFPRIGDSHGGPLSHADRQISSIMEDESWSYREEEQDESNSSAMDSIDTYQVPSISLPPKCHMDDDNNTSYLKALASSGQAIDIHTYQVPSKCYLDDDNNTGYLKAFVSSGIVIDLGEQTRVRGLETDSSCESYDSDTEEEHILRRSLQHPIASILLNDSEIDDSDSDVCYV